MRKKLVSASVVSKWLKGYAKPAGIGTVLVVKYEAELLILIYIVSKEYFKASKVGLNDKKIFK